jgi:hypothetical protein
VSDSVAPKDHQQNPDLPIWSSTPTFHQASIAPLGAIGARAVGKLESIRPIVKADDHRENVWQRQRGGR